jgi:hypothetical protein
VIIFAWVAGYLVVAVALAVLIGKAIKIGRGRP